MEVKPVPESRQRIATAALKEFAEWGYAGSRVDRIAAAAGINKAMIYYYFSSKEELYERVLSDFFDKIAGLLWQTISEKPDIEASLAAMADVWARVLTEHPYFGRIVIRELSNPDSKAIRRLAETIRATGLPDHMFSMYARGVSAGVLRDIDVRQAVVSFLTMNIGYFVLSPLMNRAWGIDDMDKFIEERKRIVVDIFMDGVRAG